MANRRKVDRAEKARAALTHARFAVLVALKTAAMLAAIAIVTGGVYAIFVYATQSPTFAIDHVSVRGNVRVPVDEIVRLSGLAPGQNLFLADTSAAEVSVAEHPWIRTVHIDRVFPQGIDIVVLERSAVALVDVENLYLVDQEGEVFKRWSSGDPGDLPVVTGLPRDAWAKAPDEARESLLEALALLSLWEHGELARRAPPAEVHLDPVEGVTFYAGNADLTVKLGHDAFAQKLNRLARVIAEADARGQSLDLVRLDNRSRPGWIAARVREAHLQ